jgi:predicted NBD/HSP70 family sugar kinase
MTDRSSAAGPANQSAAGHLLHLIRTGRARTRRELLDMTGLSRSTVAARLDQLVSLGYVHEVGVESGSRGRPSNLLGFDERHGVVLAADLGATHARAAVCDLAGRTLGEVAQQLRISNGPDIVLGWLETQWRGLLDASGYDLDHVVGLGVGVPGPVDFTAGRPIRPTIMPGWHDYPVRERLEQTFGVQGFVENDANIMALGEFHVAFPDCPSLLFVKVATGIGAGMVVDGRLVRGANGGSGDIGHIRLADRESGPVCACGARGCLAASASGGALARRLRELGLPAETSRDVADLAQSGDLVAIELIREAGLLLGDVLATAVSLLNPQVLVVGGDLVRAQEHFMGGVRERLHQRAQPFATRDLHILTSTLGDRAGAVGAARLVIEEVFSADAVDRRLSATIAVGSPPPVVTTAVPAS